MLTHHAYYIEGSPSSFDSVKKKLKPFHAQNYERFGIDEARRLVELASLKNYKDTVFLIATAAITTEAQQALLKLFEEPQEGTMFVIIAPALLPTLKSRMLEYPDTVEVPESKEAKIFLKSSGKERSDLITTMLKDDEGVRERVLDFVNGLEVMLSKDIKKNSQALQDIAMVRDYLGDRSPSIKMLLEHLALVV